MSYTFEIDGECVWDPSLRTGQWYLASAEAAAAFLGCQTGLTPQEDGTCTVNFATFRVFVDAVLQFYSSTRHPVQHALTRGLLLTSLVILERGGGAITPRSPREEEVISAAVEFSRAM
ncbi:DUF6086 family protein [Streptomyces sp. NPDC096033]|uniref:DUF6086 family protein n=1 Tax=Streptomyces sp. NPDC096033 TaxID=3366071 RepID=UPI0038306F70